jgi:hypothetical protein
MHSKHRLPIQFRDATLPPHAGITIGCDYAPPTNQTALFEAWAAQDAALGGGVLPEMTYSHFHEWLDALAAGPTGLDGVPVVSGERPNIWIYECTPTHHNVSIPFVVWRMTCWYQCFGSCVHAIHDLYCSDSLRSLLRLWQMFDEFRSAGRLLPAAESFASFRSLVTQDSWTSYPSSTLVRESPEVTCGSDAPTRRC